MITANEDNYDKTKVSGEFILRSVCFTAELDE